MTRRQVNVKRFIKLQQELGVPQNTCFTCSSSFSKGERGITPKVFMPELCTFSMMLKK